MIQLSRILLPRRPISLAVQLAIAACAMPLAASAQEATTSTNTDTTSNATTIQRVEVTGSRIRRTDLETPSPVQVISAKELKESGYTSVSEVLRNITANGQGTLSQSFSGAFAAGASGISLRGLTVGATLVLIDGQRMAPYALSDDGQRSFVDISQIPMEAIERIEVLKDGASSIYGSDAIAGVVNVILKKQYNGAEVTAEGGESSHRDGTTAHVSGIYGWGDLDKDGHNAYVALEYRHQDKIMVSDRNRPFTNMDWTSIGGKNLTRGVPTAANGFQPSSITGYLIDPNTGAITMLPGCTTAQFNAGQCAYRDRDLELQPQTKNINLLGSYVQRIGGDWQLNLKGSYFRSEAEQLNRYATTGGVGGLSALAYGPGIPPQATPPGAPVQITVPASYPGNTTGSTQILQYNFPELGGSRAGVTSDTFRVGADVSGTWGKWDVTAAVGASQNTVKQEISNGFNIVNLQAAFNDPVHPYLVGAAAQGNSQALVDAIAPLQHAKATDKLQFVRVSAGRELVQLPGGALALNLGAEYTHRDLDAQAPPSVANGTQIGNNAWAIGTQNIAAAYAEMVAPVLKNLELDLSVRHDKVMTIGQATTPKAGLKWSPISQLTLRGTYTEGFRAPNPAEVGNTGNYFFANSQPDPVLCANQGADPTTVPGNFPQQCNVSIAGVQTPGKNLKPERSKSYTLGTIIEPTRNVNLSVDYYHIRINNQIISALNDPNYDPTPFLVRGTPIAQPFVNPDGSVTTQLPPVGNALFAPYPYENAQFTQTSGFDLDARASWPFAGGRISAELTETHLISYKQGTAGGAAVELAGTHGPSGVSGDTGNPKDRAQLKLGWDQKALTVATTVNWVSGYSVTDPSSSNAATCADAISFVFGSTPNQQFCRVRSFTSVDLYGEYRFSGQLSLHASILNLFNKDAPLDFQTYGGTPSTFYNPALHQAGAVGRFFNIGMNYKF